MADLPKGYILSDYRIEKILGHGGFGVTYLATEIALSRRVAIKEYFPRDFAVRGDAFVVHPASNQEARSGFAWGLQRFLEEARTLTIFTHPNIIAARRYFPENGTAYLVMDYCDGNSLDKIIKERHAPLDKAALDKILLPLLSGLEEVHKHNILHRDIKPANLYIREDGSPVLLDFGSARMVNPGDAVTNLVTAGYAAIEQYSEEGEQGTWTDMYGLGATLYRAVTGERPVDASARILNDTLIPAAVKARGNFDEDILAAIDAAIAVKPNERIRTVDAWRKVMAKQRERAGQTGDLPTLIDVVPIGRGRVKSIKDDAGWKATILTIVAVVFIATFLNYTNRDNSSSAVTSAPITTPVDVPTAALSPTQPSIKSSSTPIQKSIVEQANAAPTLPPEYDLHGGLVWAPIKNEDSWRVASATCSTLTALNYAPGSWRQPSEKELKSKANPHPIYIWSSDGTSLPDQHRATRIANGYDNDDTDTNYVSCVHLHKR
jgi:serine/threonine protein kinase